MLKRDQVVALVRKIENIRKSWTDADANVCKVEKFMGKEYKVLPLTIVEAWDELFNAVKTNDVNDDAKELVLAVDEFHKPTADYVKQWATDKAAEITTVPPNGSDAMWQAWAKVVKSAEPIKKNVPPPPRILLAQGVSMQQVAKMFGLRTEFGEPDVKTLAEMMEMGWDDVFDAEAWVPPSWKMRMQDVNERWGVRCEKLKSILEIEAKDQARREGRADVPMQSIEELAALPGMRIEQIARMRRTTVDEVRDYMIKHGLTLEPSDAVNPELKAVRNATKRKKDKEIIDLESLDSHAELAENFEDRVMACLDDQLTPQQVAKLLTYHLPNSVTTHQVLAIQKRWEQGRIPPEKKSAEVVTK